MRRFVCVRGKRQRAAEVIMQSEIGGSFFPSWTDRDFFFLVGKCQTAALWNWRLNALSLSRILEIPKDVHFSPPPQRACTVKNRMKIIEEAHAFCSFHRFKLYLSICVTEDRHILSLFFDNDLAQNGEWVRDCGRQYDISSSSGLREIKLPFRESVVPVNFRPL